MIDGSCSVGWVWVSLKIRVPGECYHDIFFFFLDVLGVDPSYSNALDCLFQPDSVSDMMAHSRIKVCAETQSQAQLKLYF